MATVVTGSGTRAWYAMPWEQVGEELDVDPGAGLTTSEAEDRLAEIGPNALEEEAATPLWC